ncbi:MAG: hypothetical protein M1602_03695, partial [Firmicutes bacterium]|nr:hypothetical protein [Bacillota bacterium]
MGNEFPGAVGEFPNAGAGFPRASRMMRHVEALATRFPHRHAGDPEEALAAQYIASEMKALGLRVRVLPVPVMGWEVEAWPRLEVRPA